jgi:DNA-binding IclR family transcriptional regulator
VAGIAASDQEFALGLLAIAVPVRDEAREAVAAVSITAPSAHTSTEELADALGPHLRATADYISARLGYRRDDELPSGR